MMKHIKAFLSYARRTIDRNDVSKDVRKVGIGVIIAGTVGALIHSGAVTFADGFWASVVGTYIWFMGLLLRRNE